MSCNRAIQNDNLTEEIGNYCRSKKQWDYIKEALNIITSRKTAYLKVFIFLALIFSLIIGQIPAALAAENGTVTRSNAADKYKWNLSELYLDQTVFTKDIDMVRNELLPQIEKYKGKLNNEKNIKKILEIQSKTKKIMEKLLIYSTLSLDLDYSDSKAQELKMQYDALDGDYQSTTSFIPTEIMKLPKEKLTKMINDPGMSSYNLELENLLQQKDHILSAEEENLLSMTSELSASPYTIFENLMYADFKYPTIKDEKGNSIELTPVKYNQILESSNRALRKKAYEAYMDNVASYNNTLAATYASHVKYDVFYAQARNYDSSLDQTLAEENIPRSIYDNLIFSTHNNLNSLHDYYSLRKKALGYKELYRYDFWVPFSSEYKMDIPYDQAVKIVRAALQPLGQEYIANFDKAVANRWIDVYPDDNKNTSSYCASCYSNHPYILLNYDGSLNSLVTLAHEMGHAMHFYAFQNAQIYEKSEEVIFTSEVASNVNEFLLMNYLLQNAKSDQEKIYLLDYYINNLNVMFFYQVEYSEFEKKAHEMAEANESLTPQALNNLWGSIMKEYYGDTVNLGNGNIVAWSLIPHFYDSFYVYKYATSVSAACSIVGNIQNKEENALAKYQEFLRAGSSDYPVELLKNAGVDMSSPEPIEAFLQYFGRQVNELDTLLEKQPQETSVINTSLTYIVEPGDTLWKIAKKYHTTWQELAKLNKLENPNLLIPGSKLIIE